GPYLPPGGPAALDPDPGAGRRLPPGLFPHLARAGRLPPHPGRPGLDPPHALVGGAIHPLAHSRTAPAAVLAAPAPAAGRGPGLPHPLAAAPRPGPVPWPCAPGLLASPLVPAAI